MVRFMFYDCITFIIFSLVESSQDPFTFCVLGLIQLLVKKQAVPTDAWEFILCSLVTLMQVRVLFLVVAINRE